MQVVLYQIALFMLLLLGAFVGARLVRWLWRTILGRVSGEAKGTLVVLKATERPVHALVLALGVYIAVQRISYIPQVSVNWPGFRAFLDDAFFVISVSLVTWGSWLVASTALRWYKETVAVRADSGLDEAVVGLLATVLKVVLYFIAATTILAHFEITITSLLATAGVASLALAFAAQETIGNMLAGFTIMIDRPFRVGDRIELADGTMGDVSEIGLRSTKVLSFDNTLIVIPNNDIAQAKVVNHSYPDSKIKVRIKLGVAYGSDMEKVKRVIREVCEDHPMVLDEPEVSVFFTGFGESALDVLAVCWVADYRDRFSVIDELNMAINKRFAEEEIEIPFPQRTVHLFHEK